MTINNLEDYFNQETGQQSPANLYEPIQYILTQGGKRIRPRLVMIGTELFGGNTEQAFHAAAAFEMLHNFTLIHDDIMDDAPIRRGKPTVYRKWNSNIAILSGDALSAMALREILKTPCDPETAVRLSQLMAETGVGICEGQQLDLDFESRNEVSISEYIEMIQLKTAVLLTACLKAGAIIAGANEHNLAAVDEFGTNLGLAFQLKDDLLDVYADDTVFGKVNGGDIKVNKKTYLYLKALEDANPEQKKILDHYFSSTDFDFDEKYNAIKKVYEELSIRQKTEQAIEAYVQKGLNALQSMDVDAQRKTELSTLITDMSNRNK
ncbi:MAG: polyprenyl synthetase family protein [Bacteroidales bacterium]|nr:polyprenyl synthetase family protein [Bacteroidales bacterium]